MDNNLDNELFVRFMAPVNEQTITELFYYVDNAFKSGIKKLHLLLSTPGGSVYHGMAAYHWLKSLPIEIITYNLGSVDSIGVSIFCAGKKRVSIKSCRFLLHPVSMQINPSMKPVFDEKSLDEQLKALRIDQQNISDVISIACGTTKDTINKKIHARTVLSSDEAKKLNLVTHVEDFQIPINANFVGIGLGAIPQPFMQQRQPQMLQQNNTEQVIQYNENYRSVVLIDDNGIFN